jgi:Domain of unknown function (DUF4145)
MMARKQPLYRQEICPHCPLEALQLFLFGHNEFPAPFVDRKKIVLQTKLDTYSLFRCERCKAMLFYKTSCDDLEGPEVVNEKSPEWITELDNDEFNSTSDLLYASQYELKDAGRVLSQHVPDKVKRYYQKALNVRHEPDPFAGQIRRALEAICIDRGEPGNNLKADLEKLSARGIFPSLVADIAGVLKDAGNIGAHVKHREVTEEEAKAIDDFFHSVVYYVYELPARLAEYNKLLRPDLPEIISEDVVN